MEASQAADPNVLAHYEGLVRKTAGMYVGIVEEDYDDICQLLRIKVWTALLAFDPAKARQSRDAYVFMCVKNRVKDIVKKVRRNELFIEDLAASSPAGTTTGDAPPPQNRRDRFEARYLVALEEQVFGDIDKPLIPSTLTDTERRVIAYLYIDFSHAEIAEVMEIGRKEMATVVAGIREKMADWRPVSAPKEAPAELPIAA